MSTRVEIFNMRSSQFLFAMRDMLGHAFWVTLSRLLSRGSLVLVSILLARNLPVKQFAAYSFFHLTVMTLATYAQLGLGVTTNRYFVNAQNASKGHLRKLAAVITASVCVSVIAGLLVFLAPKDILLGDLKLPALLLSIAVFFYALDACSQNALAGLEAYRADAVLSVTNAILLVIFSTFAALSQNMEIAIVGVILACGIRQVLAFFIISRLVGARKLLSGFPFTYQELRGVFGFSLVMACISVVASTGPWLIGRMILSGDDGENGFAIYSIGLQWFSLGMFLSASISRISVPKIVNCIDNPSPENPLKHHVLTALFLSAGAALITVSFAILFSGKIISVYGDKFIPEKLFVELFIGVSILASTSQVFGILIVFSNNNNKWLIINLSFLIILISSFWILGFDYNNSVFSFYISYSFLLVSGIITSIWLKLI